MAKLVDILSADSPFHAFSEDLAWKRLVDGSKRRARYERKLDAEDNVIEFSRDKSAFSICKGERTRKKPRVHVGAKTGSFVVAVNVGAYTTCVCKHRRME